MNAKAIGGLFKRRLVQSVFFFSWRRRLSFQTPWTRPADNLVRVALCPENHFLSIAILIDSSVSAKESAIVTAV
jgi:hypothetical protein